MRRPRILVTSAAGKTGLPAALFLRQMGFPVTAFVRRDDFRARRLEEAGADVIIGNQYSLSEMRRAMAGVQRAYLCAPTAPNGLHFGAVFVTAANEAKVEHVVSMGQWLSSADHPSLFTREIFLIDALAELLPHASLTQVTPGWFADNYLMVIDMAAHLGMLPMPLGEGNQLTNAPPSNEDIARVVAHSLADPDLHAGQTYRPTGPALMSPNEIAGALGNALDRKVTYRDIPTSMMLKALKANPPSNYSDATVSQLAIYADEYRRGSFAINAPTDHVERVTGVEPETFESIARRVVATRPELRASVGGTLRGIGAFIKTALTSLPDLGAIARDRDFVQLTQPSFVQDDKEWARSHSPQEIDARKKEAA